MLVLIWMYVCMGNCTRVSVHACVWRPEDNLGWFLRNTSSLAWNFLIQLYLLANETLYLPYWDYNMLHYALLTLEALNSGFTLMWQALTSVSYLSSPHIDCLMICDGKHYDQEEKGMFFFFFFL